MNAALYHLFPQLNALITRERAYYRNPGMTLSITSAEHTLFEAQYGSVNLEDKAPVNAETLFEIGSIGKLFTAIAILQAQEAGRLELQSPVSSYLPWLTIPTRFEPICLHHLLTHSAGIIAGMDGHTSAVAEAAELANVQTGFAPGSAFHYSNTGYKLLGLVLEAVYQQPYASIIFKGIFEPLEMFSSKAQICMADRPLAACGLVPALDDRPYHRSLPLVPAAWVETNTGDGAILSNAADMARFIRMLLNRGQAPGGRLLKADNFNRLVTPWIPVEENVHYGYGIYILSIPNGEIWLHGGDMPGYEAAIYCHPQQGLGTAVLMATPHIPRLGRYILDLACTAQHGETLPELRKVPEPGLVENASAYAGDYLNARGEHRVFTAENDHLYLVLPKERVLLEKRGEDRFYTPHTEFNRFLFKFSGVPASQVRYGEQVFSRTAGTNALSLENGLHAEWQPYCGHYRSHNPWLTNFRVLQHDGRLWFAYTDGEEFSLSPDEKDCFIIEEDPDSPERLRFDLPLADGFARVWYSGCWYARSFTP